MRKTSALPALIFVVIVGIGMALAYFEYANTAYRESLSIAVGAFVIAVIASYSSRLRISGTGRWSCGLGASAL